MDVHELTGRDVVTAIADFAAVYRAAFAGEPYNRQETEVLEFARSLPPHTQRDDFRCFAASNGQHLVGFAYGYRSRRGQWWYDNVSRALGQSAAALWLADTFQLAEIAVLPAYQGRGIGAALHDSLLAVLHYPRAVLSTLDTETPARGMYRRRGWQDLIDGFYFPGVPRRYAIMGRRLDDSPQT